MSALSHIRKGARAYDVLLTAGPSIWLMSQFPVAVFGLARWLYLPLVAFLSAHVIRRKRLGRNPVAVGMGLLALYTMVTSFLSYYPTVSFLKSISLLLLAGFLLVVPPTLQLLYPDTKPKEHILRIYLYFAVAIVLSNCFWYFLRPGSSLASDGLFSGEAFLGDRFRGWFLNPNSVGLIYGVFFLPILWFEAGKHRMGPTKIGVILILLVAVVQLLASQSRAGTAAGIVSLFALVFGHRKWPSRVAIVVIMGLAVLVMFIGNPDDNLIIRFVTRGEAVIPGSGRFEVWTNTWNRLLDRPFLGTGLGVADTDATAGGLVFSTGTYTIEKGNSYLGALEELGLIGSAIMLTALLAPILKACWREITTESPLADSSMLLLTAIVLAGLVNAGFEAWLLSVGSFPTLSFWFFASLLLFKGEEV